MVWWKAWRKSHSDCGVWRKLWDSQSNPMGGFDTEALDSPSIGSRISTCLWRVGQRIGSRAGNNHCGRNDVFVWAIGLDVDFVEQRVDVCPVPHGAGGSENENDDKSVVVVVELHLMEEDDLEWVEMLGLVVELELEDGSCCALGSCPQRPACLIRPYSSSVASSLLR